jgi:CRISPR-associated protein Cas1
MDGIEHDEPPLRVMALHALVYCERLFYLEEVEELRVADDRVYAGRRLHEGLEEEGEIVSMTLENDPLGLRGKVDAIRTRNGELIPYEHKRGRPRREDGVAFAWPSDRIQLGAYALLIEAATQRAIGEGRIRYHAENALVKIDIDEALRRDVTTAVQRARVLRTTCERPPVTDNEKLCARCSLAPICLPEESRKARVETHPALRLFPEDDDRQPLHVLGHGTRVGRRGMELSIEPLEGELVKEPIRRVRSVTLHGYASISAQALDLCASNDISVHWLAPGGRYVGSFFRDDLAVQRRVRQYEGLREERTRFELARKLVLAKTEGQLRFTLRATRGEDRDKIGVSESIDQMRTSIAAVARAESAESLLGYEGAVAKAYFAALPFLVSERIDPVLKPQGRTKRPPEDRFNAALSFAYGILLREVVHAIRSVGLDPAFGLYHRPRSSAPPLALDLMEMFRVPCVDMAVLAAVNRGQFDPQEDFEIGGRQVWLSKAGRKKVVEIVEARLQERWRHPVLDYSLSYRRAIELEVRLLEKEWSGEPGLFAKMRIR